MADLTLIGENNETWWTTCNTNFTNLNNTHLKLSSLFDINSAGLGNGQILMYDAATSKWIPVTPPAGKRLRFKD